MSISRRTLIKSAIALPWANSKLIAAQSKSDFLGLMLAACNDEHGQPHVAMLRLETMEYKLTALEQRGHAFTNNPLIVNQAVIAARRPGNTLTLIDTDLGKVLTKITSSPNRHFYGHCSYTDNGEYILTSENDFENGRGIISIRDSGTLKVVDEIETFGIGPHDIQFMPDKETIVAANGGILTHPDTGRRKLNLNEMKPSLAYIDLNSAKLIDQYYLSDPKLSIRHIDINESGKIGIATQDQAEYESDANQVSLIAIHKNQNQQPELIKLPKQTTLSLNRYTADFCFEPKYNTALISSPRGNLVIIIDIENQQLRSAIPITQPSAVALSRNQNYFVVSTANGEIYFIDTKTSKLINDMTISVPNLNWDNHMIVV